jgi:hypothetical protein
VSLDALGSAAEAGGMSVTRVAGEGRQLCFALTTKRAE